MTQETTIGYFLIENVKVQGANAVSSPITYGFPAISGFMGAVHALSRQLQNDGTLEQAELSGVGVACFQCKPHMFRPHPYADYTFNQTRNPLKKKNGEYQTPPIIEEGKTDLLVTLIIEVVALDDDPTMYFNLQDEDSIAQVTAVIKKQLMQQRLCGGSVMDIKQVSFFESSQREDIKKCLLPGFVLMEAKEELIDITDNLQVNNPHATELDALMATAKLDFTPEVKQSNDTNNTNQRVTSTDEETQQPQVEWTTNSVKTGRGWLVPIPVGYQSIARSFEVGELKHSRHPNYPSQYVESVYTLGKWAFPLRQFEIDHCIWRYDHQANDQGLYLVTQHQQ